MIIDRPRIAVATAGFCAFLNLYSPQAVLPQLALSYGVSTAAAGGVVGVATLAVAGSAPFIGLLSDSLSRKLTAVIAMGLLAIPTLMLGLSQSLGEILFWRLVQGLLVPAVFTPTVALVSERWSPRQAADIMGLYIAGSALGGFLGRFLPAVLADLIGWRSGLAVLAPITLVAAAVVGAWLPSSSLGPGAADRKAANVRGGERDRATLADAFGHLRDPAIIATCVAGFAVLFSIVAVFTYINFRLVRPPYAFTASDLGMIFLVYPIGALAAPTAGPLARRLGRRRTMAGAALVAGLGLGATLLPGLPEIIAGLATVRDRHLCDAVDRNGLRRSCGAAGQGLGARALRLRLLHGRDSRRGPAGAPGLGPRGMGRLCRACPRGAACRRRPRLGRVVGRTGGRTGPRERIRPRRIDESRRGASAGPMSRAAHISPTTGGRSQRTPQIQRQSDPGAEAQ